MKAVSGPITLSVQAGYFPDYQIKQKSSYPIEETNLEDLRISFKLLDSSKSSQVHPDIELRVHYFMADGEVKQQMTKINAFGADIKHISYLPPGNLTGMVRAIGFSCDAANLTFISEAFDKSKAGQNPV
jgi:hypothetical protein